MSDVRTVYTKARAETAKLLGYGDDIDGLTAEQSTRLDIACALRIALDDQAAKLLRGESTDVSKLLSASEALGRLLPPAVLASPPATRREDPREHMWRTYLGMRARAAAVFEGFDGKVAQVAALQAELATKDAEIAALKAGAPAPDESTPAPLPDNVVAMPRPSSPSAPAASPPAAPPSKPFVNGLSDVPQHVRDTRPPNEAWRNFVKIDWQG
jgi:hypothetical protein